MPRRNDPGQGIRELEQKILLLQTENDQLTGRAEDLLLLGLIAEQISRAEEIGQVLESGLERISVLKGIPFCACCSLTGNRAVVVRAYLSFTDEDINNRTIILPDAMVRKLAAGDCVLSGEECRKTGLSIELKAGNFIPLSAICIPFASRFTGANIFFFGDDKPGDRLPGVADMLHRVIEMMASRADTLSLLQELRSLNRELDRKVEERTRELRESENRFRQFFENEPAYCYMISPDGLVLDVNKAALDVLGRCKEDILGRPLQTIYAPESLARMKENFDTWRSTGKLSQVEMVILSRNGDKRIVLLNAEAVKDAEGKVMHSISVQQDITERKLAEQKLRRLNEELDQRVRDRTAELEGKNRELERMNKLFVGRELRMVELKEKIKELESSQKQRAA
jgi:PAS domain S-box-containing protein